MFDNEIISPNLKVKKLRKILKATQDEVAEGVCTKNNLSRIENNKQNLTFSLAVGLSNNFNKIAKRKKIDIEPITAEYLIKDEDSRANEILEEDIMDLNKTDIIELFENKLYEAEELINKYNISNDLKIKLYRSASDFYYKKQIYHKSDEICDNGLKVCINSNNLLGEANFYASKSRNNVDRGHYSEALEQLGHAEKISDYIADRELFERICFNKALLYKKIKEYDRSLKHLNILKDRFKDSNSKKLLDIKMVYANCLNEQHKYEKAKSEYIEILEAAMKIPDKEYISLTYRNLSELNYNQKNYKDSASFIKESIEYNPGNIHFNKDLYFAAKIMNHVNEDAEPYLIRSLEISEKKDSENLELIEKIIYELILTYIERNEESKIMLMLDKAKELNIDYTLI